MQKIESGPARASSLNSGAQLASMAAMLEHKRVVHGSMLQTKLFTMAVQTPNPISRRAALRLCGGAVLALPLVSLDGGRRDAKPAFTPPPHRPFPGTDEPLLDQI